MIKFLEITPHILENILDCDVYLLHNTLIDVSDDLLDHLELLEKFSSSFQNILGENIFFSIHPKVWKSFLSWVEDLSKVAKASLFVKHLVSFWELLSVLSWGTHSFKPFAKSLDLI